MNLTNSEKSLLIQTSRLFWYFDTKVKDEFREFFKSEFNGKLSDNLYNQLFYHRLNNNLYFIAGDLLLDKVKDKLNEEYSRQSLFNSLILLELESLIKKITLEYPVMLLKGISFIFNGFLYPEPGIRTMEDIDILVPEKFSEQVVKILLENNYKIPEQYKNLHKTHFHYLLQKNIGKNIITLELHFALSSKKRFQIDPESFFSNAMIPLKDNKNLLYPSVNDLLYYQIFHAGFHYIFERLQWLGEIEGLIHKYKDEIDYSYIISRADKEHTSVLLLNTLAALRHLYNIDLPDFVLKEIDKKSDDFLSDNSRTWDRELFRNRLFQYKFGLKSMDSILNKILWSTEKLKNKFKE